MRLIVALLAAGMIASSCRTTSRAEATSEVQEVNNPDLGAVQMNRILDDVTDAAGGVSSALRAYDIHGNQIITSNVLAMTRCVLTIHMTRGGLLLGGGGGTGLMTCRTGNGWSAPSFVRAGNFDLSAEIGFEVLDMTLFLTNDTTASRYKGQGNLDAKPFINAVAATASIANKKATEEGMVAVQTQVAGLFAGVGISFSSISHMQEFRNQVVYGSIFNPQMGVPTDVNGRLCSSYVLPARRQACINEYNARMGMQMVTAEKILRTRADAAPVITKAFNDVMRGIP